MDSLGRITAEEEQLSGWPRRLLHIPSMTSLHWQPGNVYGNAKEPRYNILTYTWGRWRLEDDDEHASEVESVAIAGVPWHIPKISPAHFTADQFLSVIRSLSRPLGDHNMLPGVPEVDFIWLDIACIDQRNGQPESAAEVGRQADIFRRATRCFAWLSRTEESDLLQSLDRMRAALVHLKVPKMFLKVERRDSEILDTIIGAMKTVLQDPWFSSLWTLQEAFLRPDMYILSRRGRTALWKHDHRRISLHESIRRLITDLELRLYEPATDSGAAQKLRLILDLVTSAGLGTIFTLNIMAPYIASTNRTASREEDRIYAIQQIFGFRLGSSAIGFSGRSFTLPELRIQFAIELLTVYPHQSQLFLHSKPVPVGTAWLPNSDSLIPTGIPSFTKTSRVFTGDYNKAKDNTQPLCVLGIANIDGVTWATFTGQISSWSDFQTIFTQDDQVQLYKQFLLTVCLDAGDDSNMALHKPSTVYHCRGDELPGVLSSSLAGVQAVVLLLGHYDTTSESGWNLLKYILVKGAY
ncbi:hypothetical protein LZ32DRAFT_644778 [Colletotrichum eremochloae]|nr:hypothetical protein LZ32DRAFT_644778 [Colletotrichum eremochloae]